MREILWLEPDDYETALWLLGTAWAEGNNDPRDAARTIRFTLAFDVSVRSLI